MSRSVICCPVPGKAKSRRLCEAFAEGAPDGAVASVFYGVTDANLDDWQSQSATRYHLDNAWFDRQRGTHYRCGRNAVWSVRWDVQDFARLKAQGLAVAPWRTNGRDVLIVEQSPGHLRRHGGWTGAAWGETIAAQLRTHTDRPLIVRPWSSNKALLAQSFAQALRTAWVVVTHDSAAACEALLAGVPVICTGPSAADPLGVTALDQVERPHRPDGREAWAATLAAAQWTEHELRAGAAWRYWNP